MKLPDSWRAAPTTASIAIITILAWVVLTFASLNDAAAIAGGFIPARVSGFYGDAALYNPIISVPVLLTPLTATLIHAGLIHLAFNLIIYIYCGREVENVIGSAGLFILYLVGAYAAAGAQYAAGPSEITPMVGASGAISAVLGAYAMLFGQNRVRVANPVLALWLNALWLAVAWIALQLLVGFAFTPGGLRIAFAAHIGGFLAGLLLAKPLLLFHYRHA